MLEPGQILTAANGRSYQVVRRLGMGKTAEVFEGMELGSEPHRVAIKVRQPELSDEMTKLFTREIENLVELARQQEALLNKIEPREGQAAPPSTFPRADELRPVVTSLRRYFPNDDLNFVPHYYGAQPPNSPLLFIVEEFVATPGVDRVLEQRLDKQQGPLREPDVMLIGLQFAWVLYALHELQHSYSDMKFENIHWSPDGDGRAVITDWNVIGTYDSRLGESEDVRFANDKRRDLLRFAGYVYRMLTGEEIDARRGVPRRLLARSQRFNNLRLSTRLFLEKILHPDPDKRFKDTLELAVSFSEQLSLWREPADPIFGLAVAQANAAISRLSDPSMLKPPPIDPSKVEPTPIDKADQYTSAVAQLRQALALLDTLKSRPLLVGDIANPSVEVFYANIKEIYEEKERSLESYNEQIENWYHSGDYGNMQRRLEDWLRDDPRDVQALRWQQLLNLARDLRAAFEPLADTFGVAIKQLNEDNWAAAADMFKPYIDKGEQARHLYSDAMTFVNYQQAEQAEQKGQFEAAAKLWLAAHTTWSSINPSAYQEAIAETVGNLLTREKQARYRQLHDVDMFKLLQQAATAYQNNNLTTASNLINKALEIDEEGEVVPIWCLSLAARITSGLDEPWAQNYLVDKLGQQLVDYTAVRVPTRSPQLPDHLQFAHALLVKASVGDRHRSEIDDWERLVRGLCRLVWLQRNSSADLYTAEQQLDEIDEVTKRLPASSASEAQMVIINRLTTYPDEARRLLAQQLRTRLKIARDTPNHAQALIFIENISRAAETHLEGTPGLEQLHESIAQLGDNIWQGLKQDRVEEFNKGLSDYIASANRVMKQLADARTRTSIVELRTAVNAIRPPLSVDKLLEVYAQAERARLDPTTAGGNNPPGSSVNGSAPTINASTPTDGSAPLDVNAPLDSLPSSSVSSERRLPEAVPLTRQFWDESAVSPIFTAPDQTSSLELTRTEDDGSSPAMTVPSSDGQASISDAIYATSVAEQVSNQDASADLADATAQVTMMLPEEMRHLAPTVAALKKQIDDTNAAIKLLIDQVQQAESWWVQYETALADGDGERKDGEDALLNLSDEVREAKFRTAITSYEQAQQLLIHLGQFSATGLALRNYQAGGATFDELRGNLDYNILAVYRPLTTVLAGQTWVAFEMYRRTLAEETRKDAVDQSEEVKKHHTAFEKLYARSYSANQRLTQMDGQERKLHEETIQCLNQIIMFMAHTINNIQTKNQKLDQLCEDIHKLVQPMRRG